MSNKQYHKLLAFFITAILLLGTVVVLLIFIINKPKDVQINNYVGQKGETGQTGERGYTPILGVDYFNGYTPVKGIDYTDGKNAETIVNNVTIEKTEIVNVPIKGDTGDAGLRQIIYVDYTTCQLMSMYDGDDIAQAIAQLPKPCEVSNE